MAKEKTFITGASSGLGLDLARQFAQHGHPLGYEKAPPEKRQRHRGDIEWAAEHKAAA